MIPIRRIWNSWLAIAALLFLNLPLPALAQSDKPSLGDAVDSGPRDNLDSFIADAAGKTIFRLVPLDAPEKPLAPRLYWRPMPGYIAAVTVPVHFQLGNADLIAPIADPKYIPREHYFSYPVETARAFNDGKYFITPGGIQIQKSGLRITSTSPCIAATEKEIRIKCAPVRFDALGADGKAVPVKVDVFWNEIPLLREPGRFNPLVIYLPVGIDYRSTLGDFTLKPDGKIEPKSLQPGVEVTPEGLRLKSDGVNTAPPAPVGREGYLAPNKTFKGEDGPRTLTYFSPLTWLPGQPIPLAISRKIFLNATGVPFDATQFGPPPTARVPSNFIASAARILLTDEADLGWFTVPAPPTWGLVTIEFEGRQTKPGHFTVLLADPSTNIYLLPHRYRTAYAETEKAQAFYILVGGSTTAANASIQCQAIDKDAKPRGTIMTLGSIPIPAVAAGEFDSRGFTLDMNNLPVGDYQLWVQMPDRRTPPIPLSIVPWQIRSDFFVHTMSGCTGLWPTTDEGLDVLHNAGIDMGSGTGFHSALDTAMPFVDPSVANLVFSNGKPIPADLGVARTPNDQLLETLTRHQMRLIDLTPLRGAGMYNETLSYHHSYKPSVDRMIRHMSIYAQQTSEYASFYGVNYSWFPSLYGYVEGGVPTDAHTGDRNLVLWENVAKAGFNKPSDEDRKWYAAHRPFKDAADRARALKIEEQGVAWFRAEGDLGWARHNKLYNDAVRIARPGTVCTLFENAGHNTGKQINTLFADMDASCYESYTDYGDWPMSAGWVTDYTHAEIPVQPVWLTTCWGTSSEGQQKSLMHAFARGLDGGGVPMQDTESLDELARRGKGLNFVAQYGAVAKHGAPDHRYAILSTDAKKVFGGSTAFDYHAIYLYMTRLGFPPRIVTDREVAATGIPSSIKALLIVEELDPLPTRIVEAILAFEKSGGKVVLIGRNVTPIDGATVIAEPVKNIWDLSGFNPAVHADMWRQFHETWQPILADLTQKIGLSAYATTDSDRAYSLSLDAGPIRYVALIADVNGKHSNFFEPTPDLPVRLDGTGWTVRDLAKQIDLPTSTDGHSTLATANLLTEPTTLLALYKEPPASIRLKTLPSVSADANLSFSMDVLTKSGAELGPVPVEWTLFDGQGSVRLRLFRAAGETVVFHVPALDPGADWNLRAQELLTGVTVEKTIAITASTTSALAPIDDVQVIDPRAVTYFLNKPGEKQIVIESGQPQLLPLAQSLAKSLNDTGVATKVWQVTPEQFSMIPIRWYNRELDDENDKLIDDAKLIGYRKDLKSFIDTKARTHIPELGGYGEIEPRYMVGRDLILFSSGELADSLKFVSAWTPTPHIPGRGQGRLLTVFSPFSANLDVVDIISNDADGYAKATKRLIDLAASRSKAVQPSPVAPAALAVTMPQSRIEPVPRPYQNFTPQRRIASLFATPAGDIGVVLNGKKNNVAIIGAEGKQVTFFSSKSLSNIPAGTHAFFDDTGSFWDFVRTDPQTIQLRATANGQITTSLTAYHGPSDTPAPRFIADGFAVAPDGKTAILGRPGGLLIGKVGEPNWLRYDDIANAAFRFEVLYPRYPVNIAFSPDSSVAFVTWDTSAPLNSMGGALTVPTAPESILIDVATARPLWRLRSPERDGGQFTCYSGFAAVAKNGQATALFDYKGNAYLVSKAGKILVNAQIINPTPADTSRWGPPKGVGVGISDDGNLAAFGTTQSLAIYHSGHLDVSPVKGMGSLSVAPDGSFIAIGTETGDTIAINPDGTHGWIFHAGDAASIVKILPNGQTIVGANDGTIIVLNSAGKEIRRTALVPACDQSIHPATPARDFKDLGPVPEYQDPGTLAYAKAKLGAKQIAAWTPPSAPATDATALPNSMKFYTLTDSITFGPAPGVIERFVHLVYRCPADNKSLKITTQNGADLETFYLDLPTPEFRVVDIPVKGPAATIRIDADGPVQVAECSVWSFQWPSANLALVTPMDKNMDVTHAAAPAGEDDLDALEGKASVSGKMKDTHIYWPNSDPDRVKGSFLLPRFDSLQLVDGKRFGNGTIPPMAEKSAYAPLFGGFFTVDFGSKVDVALVATYDRANRQSQVNHAINVFTDFDPSLSQIDGRVLGGLAGNDQFWRLIPMPGKTQIKQLGVHVFFDSASPCGLSEVEAYR